MEQFLYLFPDTNLFIQCRPLEELDWSLWSEFSEVHLILSRPVQREIDDQKTRGNDRVGRRARKAYQRFRRAIDAEEGYELIRQSGPRVKLLLAQPSRPSSELSEVLDYRKADDEIVGHMHQFARQHHEQDVRLLTHDSGPMMTAKSLGLSFIAIPESWLLNPEPSEAEKENQRLRETIKRLAEGPAFEVRFIDQNETELSKIEGSHRVPEPLTDADVARAIQSLKERHPRKTSYAVPHEFDPRLRWIDRCEEILRNLHTEVYLESGGVPFDIVARNTGTRPGKDVLVAIATSGNLRIRPDSGDDGALYAQLQQGKMSLPSPPDPRTALDLGGTVRALSVPRASDPNIRRDPNTFYYKPGWPESPATSYSLECAQWRHGIGAEYFQGEIFVEHGVREARGTLECTIHADNLPTPVTRVVPVRIKVENVSVVDRANALVSAIGQRA